MRRAEDAAAADQVVAEVDAIEAELEHIDVALDTDPLVPTAAVAAAERRRSPSRRPRPTAAATDAAPSRDAGRGRAQA